MRGEKAVVVVFTTALYFPSFILMSKKLFTSIFLLLIIISFILVIFTFPKIQMANIYNSFSDIDDFAYIDFPSFYVRKVVFVDQDKITMDIKTSVTSDYLAYSSYDLDLTMPFIANDRTFVDVASYIDYCYENNLNPWEHTYVSHNLQMEDFGGYIPSDWPIYYPVHNSKVDRMPNYLRSDKLPYQSMPLSVCDLTTYIGTPYEVIPNSGLFLLVIDYTFNNVKVVPNGLSMLIAISNYDLYCDANRPNYDIKSYYDDDDGFFDHILSFFESMFNFVIYPFKWVVYGFQQINYVRYIFSCFL